MTRRKAPTLEEKCAALRTLLGGDCWVTLLVSKEGVQVYSSQRVETAAEEPDADAEAHAFATLKGDEPDGLPPLKDQRPGIHAPPIKGPDYFG